MQDLGLKVCPRGGMPKITIDITGLHGSFGRDFLRDGRTYWEPSKQTSNYSAYLFKEQLTNEEKVVFHQ